MQKPCRPSWSTGRDNGYQAMNPAVQSHHPSQQTIRRLIDEDNRIGAHLMDFHIPNSDEKKINMVISAVDFRSLRYDRLAIKDLNVRIINKKKIREKRKSEIIVLVDFL